MSHRKTHERMVEAKNQRGRAYLRPVGPDRYFWRHVVQDGDCWLWTGILNWLGYGYVARQPEPGSRNFVRIVAHRYAYEDLVGEIPAGLELDHLCRNRACVNPDHLDPVPHRVNMQRVPRKAA